MNSQEGSKNFRFNSSNSQASSKRKDMRTSRHEAHDERREGRRRFNRDNERRSYRRDTRAYDADTPHFDSDLTSEAKRTKRNYQDRSFNSRPRRNRSEDRFGNPSRNDGYGRGNRLGDRDRRREERTRSSSMRSDRPGFDRNNEGDRYDRSRRGSSGEHRPYDNNGATDKYADRRYHRRGNRRKYDSPERPNRYYENREEDRKHKSNADYSDRQYRSRSQSRFSSHSENRKEFLSRREPFQRSESRRIDARTPEDSNIRERENLDRRFSDSKRSFTGRKFHRNSDVDLLSERSDSRETRRDSRDYNRSNNLHYNVENDYDPQSDVNIHEAEGRTRNLERREPPIYIDKDIQPQDVGKETWSALRGLSKDTATRVAEHLIMMSRLTDTDPDLAYRHAERAQKYAGRVGVVREAVGLCAYVTGNYETAIHSIRAFRRICGFTDAHRAIEADCMRALGQSERALVMISKVKIAGIPIEEQVELAIVKAAIHADLGEYEHALGILDGNWVNRISDPYKARVYSAKAGFYEQIGNTEMAERFNNIAEELDPAPYDDSDILILEDETNEPLNSLEENSVENTIENTELDNSLSSDVHIQNKNHENGEYENGMNVKNSAQSDESRDAKSTESTSEDLAGENIMKMDLHQEKKIQDDGDVK